MWTALWGGSYKVASSPNTGTSDAAQSVWTVPDALNDYNYDQEMLEKKSCPSLLEQLKELISLGTEILRSEHREDYTGT